MPKDSTQPRGTQIKLPLTPLQRIVVDLACMSADLRQAGKYRDSFCIDRAIAEIMPVAKQGDDADAAQPVPA